MWSCCCCCCQNDTDNASEKFRPFASRHRKSSDTSAVVLVEANLILDTQPISHHSELEISSNVTSSTPRFDPSLSIASESIAEEDSDNQSTSGSSVSVQTVIASPPLEGAPSVLSQLIFQTACESSSDGLTEKGSREVEIVGHKSSEKAKINKEASSFFGGKT